MDLQDVLNQRQALPIPYSFVFTAMPGLNSQDIDEAFGPVQGHETKQYRTTSKFSFQGQRDAYAVTNGILFFAPHGDDEDRVNIFLKPSIDKPTADVGVKIKFYVYRGVLIKNLFKTVDSNYQLVKKESPDALQIIKETWDEYLRLNFPEAQGDSSNVNFFTERLGFPDSGTSNLVRVLYAKDKFYNLPIVNRGDIIGKFEDSLGFEIVIDEGDLVSENSSTGFDYDLNYITAKECVLNVYNSSDQNPDFNPEYVCGAIPNYFNERMFKENIYKFLDPAAYYGAHITKRNPGVTKEGRVQYYDGSERKDYRTAATIYDNVVSKFATAENLYLYIISKRGRSYNFYGDIPLDPSGESGPIKIDVNATGQPFINFETHEWPLLILTDADILSGGDQSIIQILFSYLDQVYNDIIFCHDTYNFNLYSNLKIPLTPLEPYVAPRIFTLYKPAVNGQVIGNFIYMAFGQDLNLAEYYNDLFGTIDVLPLFQPEHFGGEIPPQWISDVKLRLLHINRDVFSGEMKVFFEGNPLISADGNVVYDRRLYIISPTEFSPEFTPVNNDFNGTNINSDNKSTAFISGYSKIINDNNATERDKKRYNFGEVLFNNLNTEIWKGEINDGGIINVLALRNILEPEKFLPKFTQLFGITQQDYEKITNGLTNNRYNEYFHLTAVAGYDNSDYKKYSLGIRYDDQNGTLQTHLPSGQNVVFIYSLDGKFFSSAQYANTFPYAKTLAKTTIDLIPKNDWDGEFGYDWMRTGNLGYSPDPQVDVLDIPYKGRLGIMPTQTDGNQWSLPFVADPIMYNHLKVEEYSSIPMPWRLNSTDPDSEYFTPWLSIASGQTISLKLRIKVKAVPDNIRIEYNPQNFTLSGSSGTVVTNGSKVYFKLSTQGWNAGGLYINQTVTIKCNQVITAITTLNIFADELENNIKTTRLAGIVNVLNNDPIPFKFLFVPFKIKMPNNAVFNYPLEQLEAHKSHIEKFLRQSNIIANVTIQPEVDLTNDEQFNHELVSSEDPAQRRGYYVFTRPAGAGYYIRTNFGPLNTQPVPPGFVELKHYLMQFAAPTDTKTMRIYFINHEGGSEINGDIPTRVGGYAGGGRDNEVMILHIDPNTTSANETASHEVYHALGLPHTFNHLSDNSKFVYDSLQTDNLMDYSHVSQIQRRSLYYWQWLIARKTAQLWRKKRFLD